MQHASRLRLALAALALCALAAAGLAYSSTGPSVRPAHQSRAFGGGRFSPTSDSWRDFALDARQSGSGRAAGEVWYGGSAGHHMHEQVTCLNVAGGKATVGAIIVDSDNPDIVGWVAMQLYADNGPPGSGAPDAATFQEINPADDPSWPTGFPYVCPTPDDASALFGLDFFPLTGGDVALVDGRH
jgi:hypothetical protein